LTAVPAAVISGHATVVGGQAAAGAGLAVLAPLAAAACFGIASVVQQVGARRAAPSSSGLGGRRFGPALLLGLARQPLYLLGLALDGAGFALTLVGLRHLPVFLVEAAVASAVVVTAVLAGRYLGDRLTRQHWSLVGAVVVGLTLAGAAAEPGVRSTPGGAGTALLAAGLPLLALAGVLVDRRHASAAPGRRPAGAAVLGALAGVGFGGFALAGRLMPAGNGFTGSLAEPVLWLAVLYAVLGLGLYGAALQRGSVTAVTAVAMAAEALFPSAVGLLLLSDRTRPGLGSAAAAGFALTVGAALALAASRSAEVPAGRPEAVTF
jgi:drug/metabolite transporter (DMT)-like permease